VLAAASFEEGEIILRELFLHRLELYKLQGVQSLRYDLQIHLRLLEMSRSRRNQPELCRFELSGRTC